MSDDGDRPARTWRYEPILRSDVEPGVDRFVGGVVDVGHDRSPSTPGRPCGRLRRGAARRRRRTGRSRPASSTYARWAMSSARLAFCSTTSIVMPSSAVELAEDAEQVLHDERRQAERRLVEQQQLRPAHQRPGDGEHLLLAAATGSRPRCVRRSPQPGEHVEPALDVGADLAVACGRRRRRAGCPRRTGRGTCPGPGARGRCRGARCSVVDCLGRCSSPSNVIDPSVATIWQIARSVVVLPAPLAPRMTTTSPRSTVKSTPCSTSTGPYPARSSATSEQYAVGSCSCSPR